MLGVLKTASFGALLRHYRVGRGLSQEGLAEKAGLSARGISYLERGSRRLPQAGTVGRLVAALDLADTDREALVASAVGQARIAPTRVRTVQLPVQLTSFVGRDAELAELARVLETRRFVTLQGPGGIGKTRLAIEAARNSSPDAVFVDLAALDSNQLVPSAVASAFGIGELSALDLEQRLSQSIGDRPVVVLLDNCEHVLAGAGRIADHLLRTCPGVSILATSREHLAVSGETVWPVPPLRLPARGSPLDPEQLVDVPAVRLFVERAQAAMPGFELCGSTAPAVAEVCRRLDGLPLALELAAARARALSVQELAKRLDQRLHMLVGGSRTAPPRQQTLRATLDWSFEMLSDAERTLFARLSVFSGFTIQAAEAVCAGADVPSDDILQLLVRLVDRSVVAVEQQDGTMRYHLLESVRQYAQLRLAERGKDELRATRSRHAAFYRTLASIAERALWGSSPRQWMQQLSTEIGNLRAAIDWSVSADGEPDLGLGLAADLWLFWTRSGRVYEGLNHLRRVLAASPEESPSRAWGLHAAANVSYFAGDLRSAESLVIEALTLAEATGDARTRMWASMGVGTIAVVQGQLGAGEDYLQAGLRLARNEGDQPAVAFFLCLFAEMTHLRGDDEAAQRVLLECLSAVRTHDMKLVLSFTLLSLGRMARVRGDYARARNWQAESIALSRALGDSVNVSYSLDEFAAVASAEGQYARAGHLFGLAASVRAPSGAEPWLQWRGEYERALSQTRCGLGSDAFERTWLAGGQLTLDDGLRVAMS